MLFGGTKLEGGDEMCDLSTFTADPDGTTGTWAVVTGITPYEPLPKRKRPRKTIARVSTAPPPPPPVAAEGEEGEDVPVDADAAAPAEGEEAAPADDEAAPTEDPDAEKQEGEEEEEEEEEAAEPAEEEGPPGPGPPATRTAPSITVVGGRKLVIFGGEGNAVCMEAGAYTHSLLSSTSAVSGTKIHPEYP